MVTSRPCPHPIFRVVDLRRTAGDTGVVATVCTTCGAVWAVRQENGPTRLHDKGSLRANVAGEFKIGDRAEMLAGPSSDLEACQIFATAENDRRYINASARVGFWGLIGRLEIVNALFKAGEITKEEAARQGRAIDAAMDAVRRSEAA